MYSLNNEKVSTDLVSCLKYLLIDGFSNGTDIESWILSFLLANSERKFAGGKFQPRHNLKSKRRTKVNFTK